MTAKVIDLAAEREKRAARARCAMFMAAGLVVFLWWFGARQAPAAAP